MLYRNVITGAEFESKSIISAPNWIPVGAESPKEDPVEEVPKQEQTETKKAAPKKTTKRTRK